MIKKLMRHSAAAAGFAALLLVGACASNDGLVDNTTDPSDQVVQVRPEEAGVDASVAPAPGPAKIDSDGNVYSSSAAPGRGNTGGIGTNTNVNVIPEKSTVEVTGFTDRSPIVPDPAPVTSLDTTPMTTTTTIETTTAPMTSSVQETTTTTTTTDDDDDDEPTPARTRMRKD